MALQKAVRGKGEVQENGFVERRCETRFALEVPVVVFPIQPDGLPGGEMLGTTVDICQGGIGLRLEQDSERVPDVCLVGVEHPDGNYRYAAVEWRHRRLSLPEVRFGGRFLTRADDPFSEDKLIPRFDAQSLQIQSTLDQAVLHEWANRGVLRPRTIDRVKLCPRCDSLPTFRDGCLQCGSAPVTAAQLVHHFACAHVGPLEDYATEVVGSGQLHCPKCQVQNLVVGADFEYLAGPVRCCECDWNDTEPALIGECLRCGHRFAGSNAVEKDVLQYHVERLDPLAFIPDAS